MNYNCLLFILSICYLCTVGANRFVEHRSKIQGIVPADVNAEGIETGYASVASSENYGGVWTAIDYKEGYSWFDVAMSSSGERIVAIGAPGGIFLSEDFGASWEQSADAPDDANYHAVASSSDGQYLAAAFSTGSIFMSRDFGVTWRNCTGAPYSAHWYDIAMSGTGQYVVGVVMGGYMYLSSDYGQSWEKGMFSDNTPSIHSNLQADFFAVAISETGQHMSIVSSRPSRAVFHSSDFGATFDPSTFDSSVSYLPQQWVSTTLDSTGQNVTIANSLVPGGVFRSTDFGRSFQQVAHAPNVSVVFTRGDGATVGAFDLPMGKPGHIYISLDRGESWNMSSPGGEWMGGAMSATGDFIVAADYSAALYSYLPNCQLGYVHAGFSSDGTNDCVACSPGSYTEGLGAQTCTECAEGSYSSSSGADGEDSCQDCVYPWSTRGEGASSCPVLWLHAGLLPILLLIAALLAILTTAFIFGNDNQLVVLIIMLFPALDAVTDLVYLLVSRFYNVVVFIICVLFFLHPLPMFLHKLYRYRAWPYSLRYIWWLGYSSSAAAAGTVQGDHIPYPTCLGRRVALLCSFEHHDSLYAVLLEGLTWVAAVAAQALTLVLLPLFLTLWLAVGVFLQMTKTIAMGTMWNVWFQVWTGYQHWDDEYGTVDTEDLNYGLLAQFCLETVPHIILQSVNNTLLGTWVSDPIAILSLTMSVFMAVATIYKYAYHVGIRADPQGMKDVPLDRSVKLKLLCTDLEYTLLHAKLEPHSRNIVVPTQQQLWYTGQKYALMAAEEDQGGQQEGAYREEQRGAGSKGLTSALVDAVGAEDADSSADNNTIFASAVLAPVYSTTQPTPPTALATAAGGAYTGTSPSPSHVPSTGASSPASLPSAASFPAELLCPLTRRIMTDPVFCADGYTYEREAIEQHFASQRELLQHLGEQGAMGRLTSPTTKQPLSSTELHANRAVLAAIASYYGNQQP